MHKSPKLLAKVSLSILFLGALCSLGNQALAQAGLPVYAPIELPSSFNFVSPSGAGALSDDDKIIGYVQLNTPSGPELRPAIYNALTGAVITIPGTQGFGASINKQGTQIAFGNTNLLPGVAGFHNLISGSTQYVTLPPYLREPIFPWPNSFGAVFVVQISNTGWSAIRGDSGGIESVACAPNHECFNILPPSPNNSGSYNSTPTGVNDAGQVVGFAFGEPFIWTLQQGTVALPFHPDFNRAHPNSILNGGKIVGVAFNGNTSSQVRAIIWDSPTSPPSIIPGQEDGYSYFVNAVSENETIVGYRSPTGIAPYSDMEAFIYKDGQFTMLNDLLGPSFAGQSSNALAVNSSDSVLIRLSQTQSPLVIGHIYLSAVEDPLRNPTPPAVPTPIPGEPEENETIPDSDLPPPFCDTPVVKINMRRVRSQEGISTVVVKLDSLLLTQHAQLTLTKGKGHKVRKFKRTGPGRFSARLKRGNYSFTLDRNSCPPHVREFRIKK